MSQNKMTGKLIIKAVLEVKTGMHIGASNDYAPIGAVDSVFIRDTLTKEPIIPGSSIKGKMRTLLAKVRDSDNILPAQEKDEAVILRLFGSAEKNNTLFSRLQFSDCMVQKESIEMFNEIDTDTYLGEVKFENTINRGTGVANPRQIERVPAGMTFDFRLVYNIENEEQLGEDMEVLRRGLKLLQLDYIGGHGSRGYGRIQFSHFTVEKFALGMEEPESVEVYETLFNGSKL